MYYRLNAKGRVEQHRRIDSREMQKQGVLQAGHNGTYCWWNSETGEKVASVGYSASQHGLTLDYKAGDTLYRYNIPLDRTACHYGGTRTWFLCPALSCGKRVAKLYLSAGIFACRHCQQLNYASQQVSKADLPLMRMHKTRDKLDWPYHDVPFIKRITKPKHMHYTKWRKLIALQDQHERQMCNAWADKINRWNRMAGLPDLEW